jgi:hypothetical protein
MKKLASLVILIVLLAGTFTPVQAASVKLQLVPELFMSSPETAFPGETHTVSLTAKNVGVISTRPQNWSVVLPKSVVDVQISSGAKMLRDYSTPDFWIFFWRVPGLRPGKSVKVEFQVTLKNDISGVHNLVTVHSSKLDILGTREINVMIPSLVWAISAPDVMVYGARPTSVLITVANPSYSADLPFDVTVEMFHNSTDGSSHYQVYGGEVYGLAGGLASIIISWRGTVPAGQEFSLELATGSGRFLGLMKLVIVRDTISSSTIVEHSYELVTGEGIPYGELRMTSLNAGPIKPGDMLAFESFYFGPTLGQFQVTRVESSCPIEGLPAGSISRPYITYAYFLHYVTLLPMEKPAGVTGPYVVTCSLTSTFNMWGNSIMEYDGTGSFEVTIP